MKIIVQDEDTPQVALALMDFTISFFVCAGVPKNILISCFEKILEDYYNEK